jgi:hypothetical protein
VKITEERGVTEFIQMAVGGIVCVGLWRGVWGNGSEISDECYIGIISSDAELKFRLFVCEKSIPQ